MRIDWTDTGLTRDDERAIEGIWQEIQPAFEARVAAAPETDAELLIGVSRPHDDEKTGEWEAFATLNLPSDTLAAESAQGDLRAAIEDIVGQLTRQLDELQEQATTVARRRQGLEGVLPILHRFRAAGRSENFFTFLQPLLRTFRSYVRRELAVLRTEGATSGEGVESSDVLDDVLLRAWERFDRRPKNGRFDLWLLKLINESLARVRDEVPHESLEERVPDPDREPLETVYQDTWIEQEDDPEGVELAEVLAGAESLSDWDRADTDGKQTGLARMLGDLSPSQRHAIVLSAAEGYEPAEIADIQDRSVDEVLADLAIARDELRRQYQRDGELDDVEDRLEDPASRARRRKG